MEKIDEILNIANKCLNCKKPMCKEGCPIATNIPEFIYQIKQKNFKQAYNILQESNPMSEICSIVCPAENQCMGHCVKNLKGDPVQISYLEKFVNNWARENNIDYEINFHKKTNKKVAVIGSGPAGIACSIALIREGANVTIFEKENECGGILSYGIPDFRLQKDTISYLIDKVKALGINIKTGVEFGKDINIQDLKEQGYENIFIAIGAQIQAMYELTDKQTKSIYNSDNFLRIYNSGGKLENLGTTIVIGGGNVAFDSARAAIRSGAKDVYILYRRNQELMPAREIELEEAIQDGVKIMFQTKVLNAKIENEKIKEIECVKTKIENNKAIDIEGSNYKMKANTIIFAIGAKIDEHLFNKMGIKTENGLICVNEQYMTNIQGVYAGGDLVEAKTTVCKAVATGQKAAQSILKNIEGSDS